MRRVLPVLLSLVLAAGAAVAGSVPASAQETVLDRARHGGDAVHALGDRLAAVAELNDTTASELRELLLSDASLWVDREGRLFYVDTEPAPADDAVPVAAVGSFTKSQVLSLHSNRRAQRTVYLDVDGVGGTWGGSIGKAWSRGYTGGDGVAEPYSLDSAQTTDFSAEELADIYSIWQRVAEDFAPFDINVTTQEPTDPEVINRNGTADQVFGTRVAITSTATDCGCGGVAYVGVFDEPSRHAHYQPAFVYNEGAKYAAEAASHEAGHNLGLSHDGQTKPDGTTDSYYLGHDDWAPIMGVGYYRPIVQWSKGEYPGATQTQDDFLVATANGGPLRADTSLVPPLTLGGTPARGAVERAGDSDEFALNVEGDTPVDVAVDVRTAFVSANLDLRVTLLNAADRTPVEGVLPVDPMSDSVSTDAASGTGAVLTATVAPGTYVVRVEGVGVPGAAGYTTYGSLGTYSVAAATAASALLPPVAPTALAGTLAADGTSVALTWTHPSIDEAGFELVIQDEADTTKRYVYALAANRSSYVHRWVGRWSYEIRAVNSAGASSSNGPTGSFTIVAPSTSTTKGNGNKK